MASVNRVILIGNVGKDPEIRSTSNGTRIANLSLATSESWKDKNTGERKERTEWHRVVVFNEHLVTVVEKFVQKGAKLYVEGALQTRKWTDNAGLDKFSTEVVLQKFKGEIQVLGGGRDNRAGGGSAGGGDAYSPPATGGTGGASRDLDDEIPF